MYVCTYTYGGGGGGGGSSNRTSPWHLPIFYTPHYPPTHLKDVSSKPCHWLAGVLRIHPWLTLPHKLYIHHHIKAHMIFDGIRHPLGAFFLLFQCSSSLSLSFAQASPVREKALCHYFGVRRLVQVPRGWN